MVCADEFPIADEPRLSTAQREIVAGSRNSIHRYATHGESTSNLLLIYRTKIVQGWPIKLWANFRALVGIFSQSVGPRLAIRANPVQFRCWSFLTDCL